MGGVALEVFGSASVPQAREIPDPDLGSGDMAIREMANVKLRELALVLPTPYLLQLGPKLRFPLPALFGLQPFFLQGLDHALFFFGPSLPGGIRPRLPGR